MEKRADGCKLWSVQLEEKKVAFNNDSKRKTNIRFRREEQVKAAEIAKDLGTVYQGERVRATRNDGPREDDCVGQSHNTQHEEIKEKKMWLGSLLSSALQQVRRCSDFASVSESNAGNVLRIMHRML